MLKKSSSEIKLILLIRKLSKLNRAWLWPKSSEWHSSKLALGLDTMLTKHFSTYQKLSKTNKQRLQFKTGQRDLSKRILLIPTIEGLFSKTAAVKVGRKRRTTAVNEPQKGIIYDLVYSL